MLRHIMHGKDLTSKIDDVSINFQWNSYERERNNVFYSKGTTRFRACPIRTVVVDQNIMLFYLPSRYDNVISTRVFHTFYISRSSTPALKNDIIFNCENRNVNSRAIRTALRTERIRAHSSSSSSSSSTDDDEKCNKIFIVLWPHPPVVAESSHRWNMGARFDSSIQNKIYTAVVSYEYNTSAAGPTTRQQ